MKQVTTITLTFELPHDDGNTTIENVRSLLDKLREHNCGADIELITNDGTDDYTFVNHDGKYSRQFGFNSVDAFVKKYAKFGAGEISAVLRDYGTFVECDSKTEEVQDDNQE